jgi:hypothetical protein
MFFNNFPFYTCHPIQFSGFDLSTHNPKNSTRNNYATPPEASFFKSEVGAYRKVGAYGKASVGANLCRREFAPTQVLKNWPLGVSTNFKMSQKSVRFRVLYKLSDFEGSLSALKKIRRQDFQVPDVMITIFGNASILRQQFCRF